VSEPENLSSCSVRQIDVILAGLLTEVVPALSRRGCGHSSRALAVKGVEGAGRVNLDTTSPGNGKLSSNGTTSSGSLYPT
jgi:hypothetical protein